MTSPAVRLRGARLSRVRVLVVDDTPYVLQVAADILTEEGAEVTAVRSAEEALAALQWERPDVGLEALIGAVALLVQHRVGAHALA